jgi:chondroitin AC lyase
MKTATESIERIRERVIESITESTVHCNEASILQASLLEDGSWPKINYEDLARTSFEPQLHLSNLQTIAAAYACPKSERHGDSELKLALKRSLDFWLKHDFISENWWWNQIGTPDTLLQIMYVLDGDLTEIQLMRLDPIVSRANMNASGARESGDRIRIAALRASYHLYFRDTASFSRLIQIIAQEIKFTTAPGMAVDYSFHHREDGVNNTLSYGLSYAASFAEWADYTRGTEYQFPDDKLEQLVDFYLDGICKMMVYARYPDAGAKNRAISRLGELRAEGTKLPQQLRRASQYRSKELDAIIAIRQGNPQAPQAFNRHFWCTDYMSHQRANYFSSVRMYSTRNHNMEYPYNGEGFLNHHRGDGANHISVSGTEYFDIWPVFDYQKIPGATVLQKPKLEAYTDLQKRGKTDFVGGISNGRQGAAAMDFQSPHDPLRAKKAWFFFDRCYVCLGAGITADSELRTATTLNQCRLNGPIQISQNRALQTLTRVEGAWSHPHWIFHDQVTYLFPSPQKVHLSAMSRSGKWRDISDNTQAPTELVTQDVFTLWLDHGARVKNGHYAYYVIPGVSDAQAVANEVLSAVRILENTSSKQAVLNQQSGLLQAVFYEAGRLNVNDTLAIELAEPGLLMAELDAGKIHKITVADPTHKLTQMTVTLSARQKSAPGSRLSLQKTKTETKIRRITLPSGHFAGQSITLEF